MTKFQVFSIFSVLCYCFLSVSALDLSSDGSYSIKVGIIYNSTTDITPHLNNIKAMLPKLSTKLYISTKEKFFLRSVEILQIPVTGTETTLPSFQGADIRISDTFQVPHTENPNICGQPGEYIELPLSFFEKQNGGPYGDHVKALLALWARFRWGVWEEHGFPSDAKYPYFYKETSQVATWAPSGCSNVPLIGDFVNQYEEISSECNVTNDEPMASTCRFKPNPSKNTATSSLMHFHYLESVTEFCDKDTHDRKSPNRQNLFCNYRSIWEVMRLTPDYLKVTRTGGIDLPVLQFQMTTKSEERVLYILLDKGSVQFDSVADKITAGLIKILNQLPPTTITTVGTYPSATVTEPYVTESITWTRISDNMAEFERIIRAPRIVANSRNFGLAIQEAAEAIRLRDTLEGAVLLIVKTGASIGSFGNIAREEEVLADLKTEKLCIFSIELSENTTAPYINLAAFAPENTELHTLIKPSTIDSTDFVSIGSRISNTLNVAIPIPTSDRFTVIYKGPLLPNTQLPLMVRSNMSKIYSRLTVPSTADARPIISRPGEAYDQKRQEWGENNDVNRRIVVSTSLTITDPDEISNGFEWGYEYSCPGCGNLEGQLLIFGSHAEPVGSAPDNDNVQMTVFTSAVQNLLDFNKTANAESPFTIFARATLNEAPVTHLKLEALIQEKNGNRNWTVALHDDGIGNPDVLEHDGVYSGTFIPPTNGAYTITATAKNEVMKQSPNEQRFERSSDLIRLIPVNQTELDCQDLGNACGVNNTLNRAFEITSDLPGTLRVVNRAAFKQLGKPMKIYTLEAGDSAGKQLMLQFTKPSILGQEQNVPADITYSIFVYQTREQLQETSLTPNGTEIRPPEDSPIQVISLELKDVIEPQDFFVAIKAHNGILESSLSNIIQISFDPNSTSEPPPSTSTGSGPTDPDTSTPTSTGSGSSTSSGESTSTQQAEEEKPFFKTGAGIAVIVLIVIVGAAAIGGGIWYYLKRKNSPDLSSA